MSLDDTTSRDFKCWLSSELFQYLRNVGVIKKDDSLDNWKQKRTELLAMAEKTLKQTN